MFERFTEKSVKVVMLAQEESRRLGHNFVGTEQILLGLVGEGTGIAARLLKSMGVNLKDARIEVEHIIGRGAGFVAVEIPFTSRAKRVLDLSLEESRQLGHNYLGTEHILLGLIKVNEGNASKVLENLGVDLTTVRTQVMRMLAETSAARTPYIDADDSADSADMRSADERIWEEPVDIDREPAYHRRDRRRREDPLETSEIILILRSIDRNITGLREEVAHLNARIKRIEGKL
jgi:ATP-dependent Clp protease ATP-binding subunit ClpC